MNILVKLYSWYGKKTVLIVIGIVVTLSILGTVFAFSQKDTPVEEDVQLPLVKTALVSQIAAGDTISLIGTVRARNEAQIESEVSGRVTQVSVTLGQTISAGQIIAQQENASQRAAVLQAEGVYEAALASAQQSSIGVDSAQTSLVSAQNAHINAYISAYTTANSVILTSVDDFFSNPDSSLPGLRINGKGYTPTLNAERVAFQQILKTWQLQTTQLTLASDLLSASAEAKSNLQRLLGLVDTLILVVNKQDATDTLDGVAVESFNSTLSSNRASVQAALSALQTAETNLQNAQKAVAQSQLGGGSQASSIANAQVKQALGSLRGAQANLNKTILRSPISGTVNSLTVNTGDYIGAFTKVAEIANNNGLEISTYVGESDLTNIVIGDEVLIEGSFTGTVTNIAPAIDSATQKSEIKIATETDELTNGDTVTLSLLKNSVATPNATMLLPITAIKFSSEDGFVFTVEDSVLVQHEVTLGNIKGSFVEVLSGVSPDMHIVLDARGLSAGGKVDVTN